MTHTPPEPALEITADTPVWEVIYHHRATEAVFKEYEIQSGHCICCEALFEPLREVAARYQLDLDVLLARLKEKASG